MLYRSQPWSSPSNPTGRHPVSAVELPVPSPRSTTRSLRAGFTLIEVMVVIVVIAALATLVAPNVFRHVGSAKDATTRSQIEMFGAALDAYRLDTGRYPTTAEGLDALWTQPGDLPAGVWRGPYLKKAVPPDPWQHPYIS
jgi:general secretion pathway protein G